VATSLVSLQPPSQSVRPATCTHSRLPVASRLLSSLTAIIYSFGVVQLAQWTNGDLQRALVVGVLPFVVGDALKVAIATAVATRLRHILPRTKIGHERIDVSSSKREYLRSL